MASGCEHANQSKAAFCFERFVAAAVDITLALPDYLSKNFKDRYMQQQFFQSSTSATVAANNSNCNHCNTTCLKF